MPRRDAVLRPAAAGHSPCRWTHRRRCPTVRIEPPLQVAELLQAPADRHALARVVVAWDNLGTH